MLTEEALRQHDSSKSNVKVSKKKEPTPLQQSAVACIAAYPGRDLQIHPPRLSDFKSDYSGYINALALYSEVVGARRTKQLERAAESKAKVTAGKIKSTRQVSVNLPTAYTSAARLKDTWSSQVAPLLGFLEGGGRLYDPATKKYPLAESSLAANLRKLTNMSSTTPSESLATIKVEVPVPAAPPKQQDTGAKGPKVRSEQARASKRARNRRRKQRRALKEAASAAKLAKTTQKVVEANIKISEALKKSPEVAKDSGWTVVQRRKKKQRGRK